MLGELLDEDNYRGAETSDDQQTLDDIQLGESQRRESSPDSAIPQRDAGDQSGDSG